ncbi:nuclease-related domain-containing protein [Paenibacillus sp. BSR1-1]|uniref:nuclease-related domain-containing protein n=1 Tax=Paenibacillus sp. BSR1-1 TaxID=3020845 RepID=UPI0025AF3150|nr:nuclease-related domain-containing protein [Paenibacillus sp. BSR1-1]MDN3018409.1 nuclease-related domain-containing protein [Paenibacillus sp. BSR1-1]
MAFKPRIESKELKILRILNTRMELTADEKKHYFNLKKGYEGEVQFDLLTEQLQNKCYILNDLLLKAGNTSFQNDTVILFQETIHLFEVKNYEYDLIFKTNRLESFSGKEYQNPLDQLNRNTLLLRQLLQNMGYNIPIKGYVIFINPEFTLYQSPPNEPIIHPTQLKKFMKKLNSQPSKLSNKHKLLAEKLVSLHQVESTYTVLPTYSFERMRKGLTCEICNSFEVSISVSGGKMSCNDCGSEEEVESAILRCVEEIKLLFPDKKITTNCVFEWCGGAVSKKKINRLLTKKFKRMGQGKYSYYVSE